MSQAQLSALSSTPHQAFSENFGGLNNSAFQDLHLADFYRGGFATSWLVRNGTTSTKFYLQTTDSLGKLLWTRSVNAPAFADINAMQVDKMHDIILGTSEGSTVNLYKFDLTGRGVFANSFSVAGGGYLVAMDTDSSNNIYTVTSLYSKGLRFDEWSPSGTNMATKFDTSITPQHAFRNSLGELWVGGRLAAGTGGVVNAYNASFTRFFTRSYLDSFNSSTHTGIEYIPMLSMGFNHGALVAFNKLTYVTNPYSYSYTSTVSSVTSSGGTSWTYSIPAYTYKMEHSTNYAYVLHDNAGAYNFLSLAAATGQKYYDTATAYPVVQFNVVRNHDDLTYFGYDATDTWHHVGWDSHGWNVFDIKPSTNNIALHTISNSCYSCGSVSFIGVAQNVSTYSIQLQVLLEAGYLTGETAAQAFGGAQGSVKLNFDQAIKEQLDFFLNSSSSDLVPPTKVTVPAGVSFYNVALPTKGVNSNETVDLTITGQHLQYVVPISIHIAELSSVTVPSSVTSGSNASATINLNGKAGSNGLKITMTSSNTAVIPNQSFTVPGGLSSDAIKIATTAGKSGSVTLTWADTSGTTKSYSITVNP